MFFLYFKPSKLYLSLWLELRACPLSRKSAPKPLFWGWVSISIRLCHWFQAISIRDLSLNSLLTCVPIPPNGGQSWWKTSFGFTTDRYKAITLWWMHNRHLWNWFSCEYSKAKCWDYSVLLVPWPPNSILSPFSVFIAVITNTILGSLFEGPESCTHKSAIDVL